MFVQFAKHIKLCTYAQIVYRGNPVSLQRCKIWGHHTICFYINTECLVVIAITHKTVFLLAIFVPDGKMFGSEELSQHYRNNFTEGFL